MIDTNFALQYAKLMQCTEVISDEVQYGSDVADQSDVSVFTDGLIRIGTFMVDWSIVITTTDATNYLNQITVQINDRFGSYVTVNKLVQCPTAKYTFGSANLEFTTVCKSIDLCWNRLQMSNVAITGALIQYSVRFVGYKLVPN